MPTEVSTLSLGTNSICKRQSRTKQDRNRYHPGKEADRRIVVLAFKHQNSDWNPGLSWLENAQRFPTGREEVSRTPTVASQSSGCLQHECLVPVLPLPPPPPQVRWLRNRDWDWYPNCTGIPHPHPHALTPAAWGLLWWAAAEEDPRQTQKTTSVTAAEAQKWLGEKGEIKARQLREQIKGEGLLGTRPCSPQTQRFQPPKATLTRTRKMPENKGEAQAFQAACHTLPGKLTLAVERRPDCPGQRGAGRPLSSSGMRPALQHALEQPNTGSHGEMQPDNGLQESHG